MKLPICLFSFLALTLAAAPAAERPVPDRTLLAPSPHERIIRDVRAADDERIAASLAADQRRLTAVYADGLRYQHSNGVVDTKDELIGKITSGRTKYKSLNYKERNFTVAAPEVVLMSGRVHFVAVSGGQDVDMDLSFLAVWRLEGGKWRFFAWQSARIPPPAAK